MTFASEEDLEIKKRTTSWTWSALEPRAGLASRRCSEGRAATVGHRQPFSLQGDSLAREPGKKRRPHAGCDLLWSPGPDLNRQPFAYKASALPIELLRHISQLLRGTDAANILVALFAERFFNLSFDALQRIIDRLNVAV